MPPAVSTPGLLGGPTSSAGPSPDGADTNSMQKCSAGNGNGGGGSDVGDNEAEGVWSPDIEQSFHEALAIYPPCGRRKIILSDEGKMYGRNELIARYIKLRTGKTRTRKQVSSHIQVLARRKSREMQSQFKDQATKDKVLQSMASMSSAQIVSAGALQNNHIELNSMRPYSKSQFWGGVIPQQEQDIKPFNNPAFVGVHPQPGMGVAPLSTANHSSRTASADLGYNRPPVVSASAWENRQMASKNLRLIDFSAFLEQQGDIGHYSKHLFVHITQGLPSFSDPLMESIDIRQIYDKFPETSGGLKELYEKGPKDAFYLVKFWADLNVNIADDSTAFYGVSGEYEGREKMTVSCSTKVCSFGKQVVEKVEETEFAMPDNDRYLYNIRRSPMCEYMINFIRKLKHLPEKYMMNSVLENFTILQVISNMDTHETLLCLAFVFEVSTSEHGAQHHMYRLVQD